MTGKLTFENNKWKISFQNEKGETKTLFCQPNVFSKGFNPSKEEETEIDFERDNTPQKNACKVRPKGQEWQGQERVQTVNYNRQNPVGQQRHGDRNPRDFQNQPRNFSAQSLEGKFHNPYNFVPAVPRRTKEEIDKDSNLTDEQKNLAKQLCDAKPIGHDKFHEGYYSGKLSVKMTVETPLVILDTARMIFTNDKERNIKKHKSFPVRVDLEGKPIINPTAVKGMLRSSYEAITDSRLSVFTKHEERLAFRSEAKLGAVPARVVKKEDGNLYFRVMKSHLLRLGFAAKLKRYKVGDKPGKDKGESSAAIKYGDQSLPKNGDAVWVQLNAKGAVEYILRRNLGETKVGWQAGWVCVTGANIGGKKNERVFLENPNDRLIKIENIHKELWSELIGNYQEIHQKDLAEREEENDKPEDYLGNEPGKTAWSRHIYEKESKDLTEGTLCYLNFKRNSESEIDAVIPVTISRRLFEVSPSELLSEKLKPAKLITQLSPADRVFGWVRQSKPKDNELNSAEKEKRDEIKEIGAHRGQIRIGSVICQTEKENAIQFFDDLPLNILGQPKPQQGRFYVSETPKTSEAQIEKRSNEDAGYKVGRGLRGRKVYPHHAKLPDDYWTIQNNLREYREPDREYIRPFGEKQRDSQNRSIQGWIKPKTVFEFDIHFTNLSKVELGALIWLLSLNGENENKYFHRFGGGKPYGFGSVKLKIIGSDVRDGKDLKTFYMSLDDKEEGKFDESKIKKLSEDFKSLADSTFPTVINSFLRACEGFAEKPTHYPRTSKKLTAETKSFEWFVENNRIERGTVKNGYVLQDLADDDGLPYLS